MTFIPIFGYPNANFKIKEIDQKNIQGFRFGLSAMISSNRAYFGCFYYQSYYNSFNGGNRYYHYMSIANQSYGDYIGIFGI